MSQGAADEPGIYGYVLAPGGIPVSGGTVVYLSFAASASTSIDGIGRFRIPVDRAGLYRVTVSVPGSRLTSSASPCRLRECCACCQIAASNRLAACRSARCRRATT